MTVFDYLAVIISVIAGLGITQLMIGFGQLLQSRGNVRFDWIHGAWTLLVFYYLIQWWWSTWSLRTMESWDFFSFLIVLLAPITMYLLTALSFPNLGSGVTDLWQHFFEGRRRFFTVFAVLPIVVTLSSVIVRDQPLPQAANYYRAVNLALFVAASRAETRRTHALLACLAWGIAIVFVIFLRLRIGQ